MKICLIDRIPAFYRRTIYELLDQKFNIDWYFGTCTDDTKTFDMSTLKSAHCVKTTLYPLIHTYSFNGLSHVVNDHDIIILNGEPKFLNSWIIAIKAKLHKPKKKVVFWTHGWYGRESALKAFLKKIYFHLGDHILTYGDYARQLMLKNGFNTNDVTAIHNSLDYEYQLCLRQEIKETNIYRNHFNNTKKNIIFIGRLAMYKKVYLLISAMQILKEQGTECNLTIIGSGECEKKLKEQVFKTGLMQQVWFWGTCYDENINAELIFNADMCVSPGNVGLNAIHTLMFGCPIATHDYFPNQGPEFEVIKENITGTFFKEDDAQSIADAITRWFSDTNRQREETRKACYNIIDKGWNPNYQIKVLDKLLTNKLQSNNE